MERTISRRDLLLNKLPRLAGLVFVAACGKTPQASVAPEATYETKPSPTSIPQEPIKASEYATYNKDQSKAFLDRNVDKEVRFDIDKEGWAVKPSSKLPPVGDEGHKFLDITPPLETERKITVLVTKGEFTEWQLTNWNFPKDPNHPGALPPPTSIVCKVIDFNFEAVPLLISVNGIRF